MMHMFDKQEHSSYNIALAFAALFLEHTDVTHNGVLVQICPIEFVFSLQHFIDIL